MVTLALVKEEFGSMYEEMEAISLPHGDMIYIPDLYWRKLIMMRCEDHRDLYSSRLLQEKTIPTIAVYRDVAYTEIKSSIVWYWTLPPKKRAELEARYRGIR